MKCSIRCLGLLAGLIVGNQAMATDYYINPTGNDSWSGTLQLPNEKKTDGPFKTLFKAQSAIRKLITTTAYTSKVNVNIAAGRYFMNYTLGFTSLDSGLPGKEILWQGEPGASVIISGGLPVTCTKRDTTFWDCPLTTLPVTTAFFDTTRIKGKGPKFDVFVDGQILQLARWPDTDWAHIKAPVNVNAKFSVMETLPAFTGDTSNAQVHIFPGNSWYDEYLGVSSFDNSANTITLADVSKYPLASGRQFYIQNILSELNAPGEWFYDAIAKNVTFIAPANTPPQEVILSSLPYIFTFNAVSNLSFKNLTLQHTTKAAILGASSSNIIMDHLVINNVGGRGIDLANSTNLLFSNNEVHHTTGSGVYVQGGDMVTLTGSGNIIDNNYIHHTASAILSSSPQINVAGVGTTVTHNLVEQAPSIGIMIYGNNQVIEKNELHHVCLNSSDCGGVYSGGSWIKRGNIIRNNYIHDVIGYGMNSFDLVNNTVEFASPFDSRGIYIDDGNSGFEVAGNILINAGFVSIHLNGGRDNKVHDNFISTDQYSIWILNREKILDWTLFQSGLAASPYKTAAWMSAYPELTMLMNNYKWPENNRIERNVSVSTNTTAGSLLFRYDIPTASTTIAKNVVWSKSGSTTIQYSFAGTSRSYLSDWKGWVSQGIVSPGVEKNSIYADPCVTISNNNLTACSTSPLNNIGFAAIPNDIGFTQH